MSVYCIVNSRQKLHDPTRKIFLNEPLQYDNAQAHCFRLTLTADDGTSPADLTDVSVVANFMRPDGGTVEIATGTITGNVVEVILPAACYASVGRYKLTVNLVEGSGGSAAARSAMIVEGITERNNSGTPVDPGTIMPSINTLISEINDAVDSIPADYDTLLDSIAQTFSESVNYKTGDFVWHGDLADGGKLYQFTQDHAAGAWTGTDVVEAVVTDGVEGNVRYDEVQALTVAQQMHGRVNIQAQHRIEPDGSVALELNDSESATITGDVWQQIQYSTSAASLTFKHVAFVQGGCDYVLSLTSGQLASANARVQAIVDDSDVIIQRFNASVAENATTETRFTAEADGILCVCVDASTEDNIQLHGGPVYGTVRYDTAQSLTDAQQAQARGNIAAASETALDITRSMSGFVAYNSPDYIADNSETPGATNGNEIGVSRRGMRVTLNGTNSNAYWRYRLTGTGYRINGDPTASQTNGGYIVLDPSHEYVISARLVSGTAEIDSEKMTAFVNVYAKGGTSNITTGRTGYVDDSADQHIYYSAGSFPADGVSVWLCINPLAVMTNAAYDVVMLDLTELRRVSVTYDTLTALDAVNHVITVSGWGGIHARYTVQGILFEREVNTITLDGSRTGSANGQVSVNTKSGVLWIANDSSHPDTLVNADAVLKAGRTYRLSARIVSGTATQSGSNTFNICYYSKTGSETVQRVNFTADAFHWISNGRTSWAKIVSYDADTAMGFGFYLRSGMSFDSFRVRFDVEDITDAILPDAIAEYETAVSSNTYNPGGLLTMGGMLYKVTQAIAPGTAITPGTNVTPTTVAAQLAEQGAAISAVEEDAEDIFMEPWQLVAKKYFIPDSSGNLTVRRNHITYIPSASQSSPAVRSLIGAYEGANTTLGGYTPTIDQLIPVSVFGDAIKIGFYLDAAGTTRYPRFAYKFCTVDGETVTPISGAQGSIPATAATGVLAETTATVPDGATHVFFGLLYSNGYTENATYDMVYKVDKG